MNMNINEMTKKQFEELDILDEDITDFNSIVLLPTRLKHDSGYNYYSIIPCLNDKPLGKLRLYDTFSIMTYKSNHCGIDCLRKSSLMRIFVAQGKYIIKPYLHQMEEKGE
jgi:hypothetical protein